jgi:hypothetical protein
LGPVDIGAANVGIRLYTKRDVSAQRAPQEPANMRNRLCEIHRLGLQGLPAAKGEEMLRQVRAPFRGALDRQGEAS